MMLQREAGARLVGQYDINNTYQYIINRDDVQLSWVRTAIEGLGGTVPTADEPARTAAGSGSGAAQSIIDEDGKAAMAFVDRWRPRVEAMTNARHRSMLRVILGEILEQQRFFEQALAGRTDLLGRRGEPVGPSHGQVLPSRWLE